MKIPSLKKLEVWFLTGTQHLYGESVLLEVAEHAKIISSSLTQSDSYTCQHCI